MSETNQTTAYYYADGQRIPLQASSHFMAVRATGEQAAAMVAQSTAGVADLRDPVETMHLEDQGIVLFKVPDGAAPLALPAKVQAAEGNGPAVYEVAEAHEQPGTSALIDHGELIVKFESGSDAAVKLLAKYHLHTLQEDYPEPGAQLVRTEREQDSAVAVANAMHELEAVEYAVPNFVRVTPRLAAQAQETGEEVEDASTPAYTPNDPLLSLQWGISKIRCPEAWDISRGSSGISIAVIDEGGNAHEDYALAPGWDARFNDSDPTPNPSDGHGVACAGIAAATANNGKGVAGVAPNCRVRHIRIAYGVGQSWSTTDAIIAAGVRKAVDLGADVLSNSWGGGGASTVVTNAFRYGQTNGRGGRGTPIAAATGNSDVLGVIYPANLSPSIRGFMAVGASNQWDQRKSKTSLDGENWWGSNYGPQVDVVAPGVKIPTTDIMGAGGYTSGNYVNTFNGTSSATPHVAGLMALILSVDPSLRSWEVEDIIKLTARDLGSAGRDQHFGFGRIDVRHALEAAAKIWYSIQVTPVFLGTGGDTYIRATIRMYNPGINTIRLNGLTFRSHGTNGTVIDQFGFTGNPGPVMLARSGNDVRFTNVLLKANGNRSSWSYSWSANWGYTFWRPGAPLFPLGAEQPVVAGPLDESQGTSDNSQTVTGEDRGTSQTTEPVVDTNGMPNGQVEGDHISVNRADKSITIVLR
ncbi:S8 family serine peptidase [Glutamicibacter sp. MNS18]|uniref:S8 family serine peptidase n=1 Tax=Glutamicibacter sp. MNS18 TaxID=2989817 RepID=UPI0022367840|nr:S8 family serine peptidase [Glutamicibacter sp. MNS18]MCW4464576.1 S8 family serine peptidase [Glutamicibacter sp. MNS18]